MASAVPPAAGEVARPSVKEPAGPGLRAEGSSPPSHKPLASTAVPGGLIETSPREAVDLEIVIPALNEESRIGATIEATVAYLERQHYRSALVVVDNGSVDHTADVVAELGATHRLPIHLINCSRRGKGAAVRQGIMTSRALHVGFCDADLATPVETLDGVWPALERGASVVIASRYCEGAARLCPQPLGRQLGGAVFRALAGRLLPGVADTQCGFKFFEGTVARQLLSYCTIDGFAFDLELLLKARAAGLSVHEVPVAWSDRTGSAFHPLRDGVRSMADALSLARRHDAVVLRAGDGPARS
jgi:glycosyltransferase involved in cell wall biosynthesis